MILSCVILLLNPFAVLASDPVTIAKPVDVSTKYLGGQPSTDSTFGILTASSDVAILTIYSDPWAINSSSGIGGHSYISVKNVGTSNIQVGNLGGIAPSKTISIGSWGNKTEHSGVWYNLECWYTVMQGEFTSSASLSMPLSASQLTTVNNYIINHDAWSITNNCSYFASNVWNLVCASSDQVSAGVPPTPMNLYNSINGKSSHVHNLILPWDYVVYYAQGTGTPLLSQVYQ